MKKVLIVGPVALREGDPHLLFEKEMKRLEENGIKNMISMLDVLERRFQDTSVVNTTDLVHQCLNGLIGCRFMITIPEWHTCPVASNLVEIARLSGIPHCFSINLNGNLHEKINGHLQAI